MKAVSLLSGGLDSQIAICLIKQQGIEVIAVNFKTPFFGANERTRRAAKDLGVELHIINPGQEYMEVLNNPVYGYGKNLNPCIDCHAFMLRKAGQFMREIDASFLITGEVLGQRPMSQNKTSLNVVEKLSGLRGLIVRPLSAKLLSPTIPENDGWIDRDKLLDISGRGRTRQMDLAQDFGITDYPSPAGGCLLTEPAFARRLKIYLDMNPDVPIDHLEVLKAGRHFYLGENNLLIVGRNQSDNEKLAEIALPQDYLLRVIDHPGPTGLLRPAAEEDVNMNEAASIVARYSDAKTKDLARVKVYHTGEEDSAYFLDVVPGIPEQISPV
ncbi:MAG: 7-cyano-7-deazaguanine synthase [Syntrophomonas sp.]